ncbi:HigA family addiction module antitoxin [Dyella sp. 20L07]|uniref:HigA family addiction module antitoxin n=1 Tax=Dyella sp. 20L07 TaxID=3384240 RepID=UPI003D2B75FF
MSAVAHPRPGDVLVRDFLKPLSLSKARVAERIGVRPARISEIVSGQRAISAELGLRLSVYFGTPDGYWTDLQSAYDLWQTRLRIADELASIIPLKCTAPKRADPG